MALCVDLHLAESLNLSLDERKLLAKSCVDVSAARVPVIINVRTPRTHHAIELARHAEQIGGIISLKPLAIIRFPDLAKTVNINNR